MIALGTRLDVYEVMAQTGASGVCARGLKNSGVADSYREYLKIKGKSTEDHLLPDLPKRAGN